MGLTIKDIQFTAKLAGYAEHVHRLMEQYRLVRFVETGTGFGQSLAYAYALPAFTSLWSCEITEMEMHVAMGLHAQLASDPKVSLFLGKSSDMLERLATVPADEPILFWLDAHFPGSFFRPVDLATMDPDENVRMPLAQEIELIRSLRPEGRDCLMIDDAWFWADGEFEWGCPEATLMQHCPEERGIGFLEKSLGATHKITLLRSTSGLIICEPLSPA